jgi:hypothetical protein
MYLFEKEVSELDVPNLKIPVMCINADDFYKRVYPFMNNDERLVNFFESIGVHLLR